MDSSRRAFLGHAAGLGAVISVPRVSAGGDQGFAVAAYLPSSRTQELLSLFQLKYPILQTRAFGVTDLISRTGFAGACPAPNTYRGSGSTKLKRP